MDEIIKVRVEEIVIVAPDNKVELATPTISTDGKNIIATQDQKGGYVQTEEKTTTIPATELDEDLKPENIIKGASIFGVEGTGETYIEPKLQEKDATENGPITADEGYDGLSKVNVNVQPELQEKQATENGIVEADNGFDGLSKVVVDVNPPLQKKTVEIKENGTQTIQADAGNYGLEEVNITVDVESEPPALQEKNVTIEENGIQTITPDEGNYGLSGVNVEVNVQPAKQNKSVRITENGTSEVEADQEYYGLEKVNIEVDVEPKLQSKTATANGKITPDEGYDGLSEVSVEVDDQPILQEREITQNGTFWPEEGYDGLSKVTVDVKPKLMDLTFTENGINQPRNGYDGYRVVTVDVKPKLQSKTVTENGEVVADTQYGYDGLSKVVVDVKPDLQEKTIEITENGTQTIVPDENMDGLSEVQIETNVQPTLETIDISENGTYVPNEGVDGFSKVKVAIIPPLQEKTITENGEYTADSEYYGLSKVNVNVPIKTLQEDKTFEITENGNYHIEPDEGNDGLKYLIVDVNVKGEDYLEQLLNDELMVYENENVQSIPTYAFYSSPLMSVSFPNVTDVGTYAFYGSEALTYAYMPNLKAIPTKAFTNCKNLSYLEYGELNALTIESYAFQNTPQLRIDFEAYMTAKVGASAFNASGITSFHGANIYSIDGTAFQSCTNLKTVDIGMPDSTSTSFAIYATAFRYCSVLTTVILRNTTMIYELKNVSAFQNTPIADGTGYIYVPNDLVDTYKAATNWSTYASQIRPLSDLEGETTEEDLYLVGCQIIGESNDNWTTTSSIYTTMVNNNIDIPLLQLADSAGEGEYARKVQLSSAAHGWMTTTDIEVATANADGCIDSTTTHSWTSYEVVSEDNTTITIKFTSNEADFSNVKLENMPCGCTEFDFSGIAIEGTNLTWTVTFEKASGGTGESGGLEEGGDDGSGDNSDWDDGGF